jgi:hypothetical protein
MSDNVKKLVRLINENPELLDRRNIHESDSEEYRKIEKRRVELSKLIEIISEERRLAKLYKML